jgi:cytochrome c biogenesis protein CcmG/thiol:disulfide interchange protein DsbE
LPVIEFRFNGVKEVKGPNYVALAGDFDLSKDGRQVRKMFPEKRTYASSGMPMTEAAIDAGFVRDVYVSLGEPIDRLTARGRMGRPCLPQALRRLDLGRLRADGTRWPDRDSRPPLPRQGAESKRSLNRFYRQHANRMNKFLWPLVGFVALVVLLAVGLNLNPRDVPSPLVNKPAPNFSLPVLGAERKFGPEDMKGKVWMLNVWASWCVSCRAEHPILVELGKKNIVPVIGLNYKEVRGDGEIDMAKTDAATEAKLTRERATKWLKQHGDPYTLSALDLDGRVGIDYGVYGVPETYIIDKAGIIRMKHTGPVTPDDLTRKILPLVAELNK